MKDIVHIAFAQLNFWVGDIVGNVEKMIAAADVACTQRQADVIVFSELSLTGYSPEDLLLRKDFLDAADQGVERLRQYSSNIAMIVGAPVRRQGKLYNSALYLVGGEIVAYYDKMTLPNHEVFDEARYFSAGLKPCVIDLGGVQAGLIICEDVWRPEPVAAAQAAGAQLIIDLNASPFYVGKHEQRVDVVADRVAESGLAIIYVNGVGGQDELVFDGASFIVDAAGQTIFSAPVFAEGVYVCRVAGGTLVCDESLSPDCSRVELIWQALCMGVRDYVAKNDFAGVVLGLSGGIDSAVTLAIAVDALGAERVTALIMPSRYTSKASVEDAVKLAQVLNVRIHEVGIDAIFTTILGELEPVFDHAELGVAAENIQARIRGLLLMAVSNKNKLALLATGNKSEMAVGYATLYGDMAGAFAPIKDVVKTSVYDLARFFNRDEERIPQRIIEREPSAELAPGQKDSDSLPSYEVLDKVIEALVEGDHSLEDIIAQGQPQAIVDSVAKMLLKSEYKRRQSPVGVKITRKAFGKDRRYPISSQINVLFSKERQ